MQAQLSSHRRDCVQSPMSLEVLTGTGVVAFEVVLLLRLPGVFRRRGFRKICFAVVALGLSVTLRYPPVAQYLPTLCVWLATSSVLGERCRSVNDDRGLAFAAKDVDRSTSERLRIKGVFHRSGRRCSRAIRSKRACALPSAIDQVEIGAPSHRRLHVTTTGSARGDFPRRCGRHAIWPMNTVDQVLRTVHDQRIASIQYRVTAGTVWGSGRLMLFGIAASSCDHQRQRAD